MPDHIKTLFIPATKIMARQFKGKEEDLYAPMHDFKDFEDVNTKADCHCHSPTTTTTPTTKQP